MPSSSRSETEPGSAPEDEQARLPLARGEDRLRLLYTLPLRRAPLDSLLVSDPDDESWLTLSQGWLGTTSTAEPARLLQEAATEASPRYDAVLLPDILGTAAAPSAEPLVRAARQLLRPGGSLVGHMPHLMSVHGLRTGRRWRPGSAWATPARVVRALQRAGFVDAECFLIEPHARSPMVLIPAARAAARRHFMLSVRRTRAQHGRLGHGLRLLAAHSGLGGLLQPDLFFWAHAPC